MTMTLSKYQIYRQRHAEQVKRSRLVWTGVPQQASAALRLLLSRIQPPGSNEAHSASWAPPEGWEAYAASWE